MQLFHGGREQISAAPRAPAVAPSAVPSPRFASEPRALTAAELRALVDGYATAARHCREGGIDGIEVSMSHGYLIAQFFSPRSNRRDGRVRASRCASPREVLEAVRVGGRRRSSRSACGWRPTSWRPTGSTPPPARSSPASCARPGLADFASFVLGHSAYVAASSWIAPPPPAPEAAIEEPLAAVRAAVEACR